MKKYLLLVSGAFLFAGFGCSSTPIPNNQTATTTPTETTAQPTTTTISYITPENKYIYIQTMGEYVSSGETDPTKNPLNYLAFVTKQKTVPFTTSTFDVLRTGANAAALEIPPGGGPAQVLVAYFKIVDHTAYVLLNIDVNGGWAGVSIVQQLIHPLVEKTLLQSPEIKKVLFTFAPGDSAASIEQ